MTDQVLRAALLKLQGKGSVPASQFTPVQRRTLDRFARQTGAVSCQRQGRGDVYLVREPALFEAHLKQLSPQSDASAVQQWPSRAQNVAFARSSKARQHQHSSHYLLLKAVGGAVTWREGDQGAQMALASLTADFGAATLRIESSDAWYTDGALWLVENQALFDRTDWLPQDSPATVLYYGGQIDGRLLAWLGHRPRAGRVVVFPDYDGVGLANFARIHGVLGAACEFWLMPDWPRKLERYGSHVLWRDTLRHFTAAASQLPECLHELMDRMQRLGLALEQEAVWLPGES